MNGIRERLEHDLLRAASRLGPTAYAESQEITGATAMPEVETCVPCQERLERLDRSRRPQRQPEGVDREVDEEAA